MVDLSRPAEEILDKQWLCVWYCFVEEFWNFIRKPDEDNYPYSKGREWCKPHYTFSSMRRDKCKPAEVIDEEVALLAKDYWERNRSELKEYFVNWTCYAWDNELSVHKDLCGGWIDCGADPAYPNRKSERNVNDAAYLASTGKLEQIYAKAIDVAAQRQARYEFKRVLAKARRRANAEKRLLKVKLKKLFKKMFSWIKI